MNCLETWAEVNWECRGFYFIITKFSFPVSLWKKVKLKFNFCELKLNLWIKISIFFHSGTNGMPPLLCSQCLYPTPTTSWRRPPSPSPPPMTLPTPTFPPSRLWQPQWAGPITWRTTWRRVLTSLRSSCLASSAMLCSRHVISWRSMSCFTHPIPRW